MKKLFLKFIILGVLLGVTNTSADMYFIATYEEGKTGIFKTDGTTDGTVRVVEAMPDGTKYPDGLIAFKDKLYYSLTDSNNEANLYSFDGLTTEKIELYPDGNDQVSASYMGTTSTHIFFTGTNSTGRGIFAYDGENPPLRVLGASGNFTYNASKDNVLYFGLQATGDTSRKLYKSDGTVTGTVGLKEYNDIGSTGLAGDKILFTARPDTNTDHQLYISDGTTDGTQLLKIINPTAGATIQYMVNDGNTAIFSANDGSTWELWESDGTSDGTKKFTNGVVNNIALFVYKDGTAYFSRNDGTNGSELWSFDKTNGANMLSDFSYNGDASLGIDISLDEFDDHFDNGKLFFAASTKTTIAGTPNFTDKELWVYDGNSTYLLKDIFPGTYEEEDFMMGGTYKVANKSNPSNFASISFNISTLPDDNNYSIPDGDTLAVKSGGTQSGSITMEGTGSILDMAQTDSTVSFTGGILGGQGTINLNTDGKVTDFDSDINVSSIVIADTRWSGGVRVALNSSAASITGTIDGVSDEIGYLVLADGAVINSNIGSTHPLAYVGIHSNNPEFTVLHNISAKNIGIGYSIFNIGEEGITITADSILMEDKSELNINYPNTTINTNIGSTNGGGGNIIATININEDFISGGNISVIDYYGDGIGDPVVNIASSKTFTANHEINATINVNGTFKPSIAQTGIRSISFADNSILDLNDIGHDVTYITMINNSVFTQAGDMTITSSQAVSGPITVIDASGTNVTFSVNCNNITLGGTLQNMVCSTTDNILRLTTPPTITDTPTSTIDIGSKYNYTLTAIKGDGDDLNWSVKDGTSLPSWLSLSNGEVKVLSDKEEQYASRIAVDSQGNVYFTNADEAGNPPENTPSIKRYNIADSSIETILDKDDGLGWPKGILIDSNDNVYFSDAYNKTIQRYNIFDSSVDTIVDSGIDGIDGFDMDSNGNIYFADTGNQTLKVYDSTTQSVSTLLSAPYITGVFDVKLDANGNLYLVDLSAQSIRKYNIANTTLETVIDSGLNTILGVDIDSNGYVYIADRNDKNIKKYNPNDGSVIIIEPFKGTNLADLPILDIAIDSNDNFYMALYKLGEHHVVKFSETKLSGIPTSSDSGVHSINLTLSDGINEVDYSFTITVPGELSIIPTITKGTTNASTKITYTPANGNSLKYMFSNSSVSMPTYGEDIPVSAIAYTSGTDITNAEVGKYLVVYEVDSNGKVVGFYEKELVNDDILVVNDDINSVVDDSLKAIEIALGELRFEHIKNNNEKSNYITTDLNLISSYATSFGDVDISWVSSDENIISTSGVVTRVSAIKQITLTATLTKGDETRKKFIFVTVPSNSISDSDIIQKVKEALVFDTIKNKNNRQNEIYSDLNLSLVSLFGTTIDWSSSDTNIIDNDGTVTRDIVDTNVTLRATITINAQSNTSEFNLIVPKVIHQEADKVLADKEALSPKDFLGENRDTTTITTKLNLPTSGKNSSTISWSSSDTNVIGNDGTVIRGSLDKLITLKATITSGTETQIVIFNLKVLKYATQDILSLKETNTTISGEPTVSTIGDITTLTTIFSDNTVEKNSTVTINTSTGLSYESTRQTDTDGSIKTTLEFTKEDNQKIASSTLYQNPNGTIENIIELKDENNDTKVAKISSLIPSTNMSGSRDQIKLNTSLANATIVSGEVNKDGSLKHIVQRSDGNTTATSHIADTSILIKENGEVQTIAVFSENITISAIGNPDDGSASHTVKKGNLESKATVSIPGAQTAISITGSVDTKLPISLKSNGCSGSFYAEVVTDSEGNNITKFRNDDENCYKAPTLKEGEEFPIGSESNITQIGGSIHIQTTTPILDGAITFAIE